MPKTQCDSCGMTVAMKITPQTNREYCPECHVVQSEREYNGPPMP